MSASIDWLSGDLPPSPTPRDGSTPLFDGLLCDMEPTAVLYRVEELNRVLEPAWPTEPPAEDLTAGQFVGELSAKPDGVVRRVLRRLRAVRWSGTRVTAAVSSALVLGGTGAGALWLVIR